MNKIIGGLLVVSLLSRPNALSADYLAYRLFCEENEIIVVIRGDAEEEQARVRNISTIMADISENSRVIGARLRDKTKMFAKLQTQMDLLRYAKVNLNDEQMNVYAGFMRFAQDESRTLSEALQKIDDGKDLSVVTKELLHNDADYDLIYDELDELNASQRVALASLDNILEWGNYALSVL